MDKEEQANKYAHDHMSLDKMQAAVDYSHYFKIVREAFIAGFDAGIAREANSKHDNQVAADSTESGQA